MGPLMERFSSLSEQFASVSEQSKLREEVRFVVDNFLPAATGYFYVVVLVLLLFMLGTVLTAFSAG